MCVENIFFKAKKLQMKSILGQAQVALRKCKGNSRTLNAGSLKQQGTLERLVCFDEGFKFLRTLRGSPPYFEKAKKNLFAMIRQLGAASLFCSFSSAETQWTHLLKILGQLVDNREYIILNFDFEERCRLIQQGLVTCARHLTTVLISFWGNFFVIKQYRQLISTDTTDYKTCLDHIYTNLPQANAYGNLLETHFSDHKAVYVLIDLF